MNNQRIAQFELIERIGEGGMGVVWKARDTRLNRTVALKLLPQDKTDDAARRQRFAQEAKTASALNHPNIVTIYDINEDAGQVFIAMEYIEGQTLESAINGRPLGTLDALKYATQIAAALASAHAAGIVHRDLKPANIIVAKSGAVKVLDFGLAKLSEPANGSDVDSTVAAALTEEGTIVGSLPYMSPEQAEGRKVDARSDIFSFGALLYEMLTGRRAFEGQSKASTLAAVLEREPKPISEIAPARPRELERLVARCLRKDLAQRAQSMADVGMLLDEIRADLQSGAPQAAAAKRPARSRRWLWASLAGALAVIVPSAIWLFNRPVPPAAPLPSQSLTTDIGSEVCPTLSPDGSQVAFEWDKDTGSPQIYVKSVGPGEPVRLTSGAQPEYGPAWSPDGRFIAFLRRIDTEHDGIYVIPARGGAERSVTTFPLSPLFPWRNSHRWIDWSPDSQRLIVSGPPEANAAHALFVVSATGGERRRLTSPPSGIVAGDRSPAISPDGRSLAFVRAVSHITPQIYLLDLAAGLTAAGEPRALQARGEAPAWTLDGRSVIYSRGDRLWRVAPRPDSVPEIVSAIDTGGSFPTISRGGILVYAAGRSDVNIWRQQIPPAGGAAPPPESLIASTKHDSTAQYSPDGTRIAFSSNRSGHDAIWTCSADGTGCLERLSVANQNAGSPRWSPDGRQIAFDSMVDRFVEVYVGDLEGGSPRRLTTDQTGNAVPSWSRDGKWIYHRSMRSGRNEIWKVPASGGAAVQVTKNGASFAIESPAGDSLYYIKAEEDTRLWQSELDGSGERVAVDAIASRGFCIAAGRIFYLHPEGGGRTTIRYLQLSSGAVTTVATLSKPLYVGLSASPDGQLVIYSQFDQSGSDLMYIPGFR